MRGESRIIYARLHLFRRAKLFCDILDIIADAAWHYLFCSFRLFH